MNAPASGGAPTSHLYIHVPFCVRKCRYCAFYSVEAADEGLMDRFVTCVATELGSRRGPALETVYLGGGTPSLLGAARIARLLDAVRERSPVSSTCEVTLEVNPETIDRAGLQACRSAGVNRVSIGIQSFVDSNLEWLGRIHDAHRGRQAVEDSLSLGLRTSIDLIYGLPGQSVRAWEEELVNASGCGTDHISAYELTWEPGTPLYRERVQEGRATVGGRIVRRSMGERFFFATHETLERLGFEGYEVSSFARRTQDRSRHNLATWAHRPYRGVGPAAHSYVVDGSGHRRTWNRPELAAWLEALERGARPPADSELLSPEQLLMERVMLGLRCREGIDLEACRAECGETAVERLLERASAMCAAGAVELRGRSPGDRASVRVVPTLKGMALADRLALELCD